MFYYLRQKFLIVFRNDYLIFLNVYKMITEKRKIAFKKGKECAQRRMTREPTFLTEIIIRYFTRAKVFFTFGSQRSRHRLRKQRSLCKRSWFSLCSWCNQIIPGQTPSTRHRTGWGWLMDVLRSIRSWMSITQLQTHFYTLFTDRKQINFIICCARQWELLRENHVG